MKITHTTILYLAVITVVDCSKMPWFEAQTFCRNKNLSITLHKNESADYYWSGLYERTSHWIKIIGCYSESILQNRKYILSSFSSPFQCQEHCLQQSIDEFAVQGSKCVCLSPDFNVTNNQLPSSECTYTCNNSALLSTECGGNSAFNVFFTDRPILTTETHCISLQCGGYPEIVTTYECSKSLPPLCSTNILEKASILFFINIIQQLIIGIGQKVWKSVRRMVLTFQEISTYQTYLQLVRIMHTNRLIGSEYSEKNI